MKKRLLIAIAALAVACSAAPAPAAEPSLNVLLTGGPEANVFSVRVSADGTGYLIDSIAPLEAPSGLCTHRDDKETALLCEAAKIAGFEVNAGGGDDTVTIAPKVTVPVTLRGGPGEDKLLGGAGNDKLVGGAGDDRLYGRGGGDWLFGGPGDDMLFGGPGDDRLVGGSRVNEAFGGSGQNRIS